jgi:hypothetical protein
MGWAATGEAVLSFVAISLIPTRFAAGATDKVRQCLAREILRVSKNIRVPIDLHRQALPGLTVAPEVLICTSGPIPLAVKCAPSLFSSATNQ